eukprot:3078460-Alexandrium_andersonii.AAC.1
MQMAERFQALLRPLKLCNNSTTTKMMTVSRGAFDRPLGRAAESRGASVPFRNRHPNRLKLSCAIEFVVRDL